MRQGGREEEEEGKTRRGIYSVSRHSPLVRAIEAWEGFYRRVG